MSNKDYFDDDLIQRRDAVPEVKTGSVNEAGDSEAAPRSGTIPDEDLNLMPLTQRKEEINSQVATKMDELERLHSRQEALEREKSSLEQLRASQEKYETGKREMIDRLEQSLVSLEREEVLVNQRLELLVETEKHFKMLLSGMRAFREEQWPSDSTGYREELFKSLAIVDNARKEYNKALARVDVLRENRNEGLLDGKPLLYGDMLGQSAPQRSFLGWLKLGFAVSLPVTVVLAVLIGLIIAKLY